MAKSKFTKEAPFEFEGRTVHSLAEGSRVNLKFGRNGYLISHGDAEAIHAFIEAERDTWEWTNDDHTEARKGRWTAYLFDLNGRWWLGHEEVGDALLRAEGSDAPTDNATERFDQVLNDFLAWKAAQDQPEEPTGFGAVVEADGALYTHTGHGYWTRWHLLNVVKWDLITETGPVTVLSKGVER